MRVTAATDGFRHSAGGDGASQLNSSRGAGPLKVNFRQRRAFGALAPLVLLARRRPGPATGRGVTCEARKEDSPLDSPLRLPVTGNAEAVQQQLLRRLKLVTDVRNGQLPGLYCRGMPLASPAHLGSLVGMRVVVLWRRGSFARPPCRD